MSDNVSPELCSEVAVCLDLLSVNDVAIALGTIRVVDRLAPGTSLSTHLVGLASVRLGEPVRALNAFEQAHALAPEAREHAEALGILHARLGHLADSLYFGKLAIAATEDLGLPDLLPEWLGSFSDAFYRMHEAPLVREAEALLKVGERQAACNRFSQATQLEPSLVAAWRGLATAALGSPSRAFLPVAGLAASARLVALPGAATKDRALHATLLAANGDHAGALEAAINAAGETRADATAGYLPIALLADTPVASIDIADAAAAFRRRYTIQGEVRTSELIASTDDSTRPLRLGVIGGDWGEGDWSDGGALATIVPILDALDPSHAVLTVYADAPASGPLSCRLKRTASAWHEIGALDDETLACIIVNDQQDALIDLNGTIGCIRPAILSARLAPLQLSLYGEPRAARAMGYDGIIGGTAGASHDGDIGVPGGLGVLPPDLPAEALTRAARDRPIAGVVGSGACMLTSVPFLTDVLIEIPGLTLVLDPDRLGGEDMAAKIVKSFEREIAERVTVGMAGGRLTDYFANVDFLVNLPENPFPDTAIGAVGLGLPVLTCRSRQPRAAILSDWLESIGLGHWAAPDRPNLIAQARDLVSNLVHSDARAASHADLLGKMSIERNQGARRQADRLVDALRGAHA